MNSFDTLIFPNTDIFHEKHYPLLLFFSPLHFLKLVEPGINSDTDNEFTLFSKTGLYQAHIPAPLGDGREQFLRLIRDINNRKEHYLTRLGKLTDASVHSSEENRKVTHSQHKISSLLQEFDLGHAASDDDLKVWQARLLLILAEILESNEEDLREELSYLDENEIAMLRSLQSQSSSEENLLDELEIIKEGLKKPGSEDFTKRFDAWLLLMKYQPAPLVKMWLASTRDSAEQIFRKHEAITKSHPIPLLKLALPAHIMASAEYAVQQIEEFHQATISIHQGLVADFDRVAATLPYISDESLLPYGTDWAEQWEGMLHKHFPASSDGRNHVTFYLLPNQPITQLLSLPEAAGTAAHDSPAHGLLGVLSTS